MSAVTCSICGVIAQDDEALRRHLEDDHWQVLEPAPEEADAIREQGGMA